MLCDQAKYEDEINLLILLGPEKCLRNVSTMNADKLVITANAIGSSRAPVTRSERVVL